MEKKTQAKDLTEAVNNVVRIVRVKTQADLERVISTLKDERDHSQKLVMSQKMTRQFWRAFYQQKSGG